jgi:lipid-A-disaccharide synthase
MQEIDRPYRIFLSAAEASGDRLCAKLIDALKQTGHKFEFSGLGGQRMADSGCEIILNTTHKAAMLYNVLGHLHFFFKAIKTAERYFANTKPDIVIVCDSPSFNFHIAKAAGKNNIKTLFYVAPQLWAWGPGRIEKLKKLCTAGIAAVLPFEPDWFGQKSLACKFVGSPMLEDVNPQDITPKDYRTYSINKAHIALMPGSRKAEIKSLWPAMQHIARRLKARHPAMKFTAVAADQAAVQMLKQTEIKILRMNYEIDAVHKVAQNVDLALVASGSATLQVAAAACPMVIMYQSNKFLWKLVGKRIVTTKYLSLVNILAQEELVPEFMPYFDSIAPIVAVCEKYLNSPEKLTELSERLAYLTRPLSAGNASQNTAQMILENL